MGWMKMIVGLALLGSAWQAKAGESPVQNVEVLVVGGGMGGLTASLYLARAGYKAYVLEGPEPGGAITLSSGVQNWPGEYEISGHDLVEKVHDQAEKNGVLFSQEKIVQADFSARPFTFTVEHIFDAGQRRKILASACVIATGTQARKLGVPGEDTYRSRGVYTCALCDGSLYKDKVVAVVGGGDSAVLDAEYLSRIAKKVYVLVRKNSLKGVEKARREQLSTNPKVEIVYGVCVESIIGSEEGVQAVQLSNTRDVLPVDALFLAIGSTPNTGLFASQLALDDQGYIKVKNQVETSVPGVFAVGDVIDPFFKQAVSAAGDGAKAAIAAQMYLANVQASSEKEEIARVVEVQSAKELRELLQTSKVPVLLDFYATWCGPCRFLSSHMDRWAKELAGKAILCKVNVDKVPEVASSYRIRSMPTVIRVDGEGKELARRVGTEEIIRYVNSLRQPS